MSELDFNSAMGLETLGNLILQELRLIRNDMKEEVRRLGTEIKLLHNNKKDDIDHKAELDLFCWQQNLLQLFGGDTATQQDNLNKVDITEKALQKPEQSNTLPKRHPKNNKNSLTDIVDMLKNKNDCVKHEQSSSMDIYTSDSMKAIDSLSNCYDNAVENESTISKTPMKDTLKTERDSTDLNLVIDDIKAINESSSHSDLLQLDISPDEMQNYDCTNENAADPAEENSLDKISQDNKIINQDPKIEVLKEENLLNNDSTSSNFLQLCESMANFRCQFCKKPFRHYSSYQSHLRTHTGEKPFVCNLCNKTFSHKGNLKTHMLCHSNEKPFVCELCDKTFVQKSTLKNHLRTHTGEKPFACNICTKRFAHRGNLTQHLLLHRNIKPHVCEYCDKRFLQKCSLIVHLRSHTGEKPFSCSVCHKAFARKAYLKQHMHLHNQEKKFSCPLCEKTFTQKGNLNAHLVRHTKNEIYQCDICKKSFKQHNYLVAHREIHNM